MATKRHKQKKVTMTNDITQVLAPRY